MSANARSAGAFVEPLLWRTEAKAVEGLVRAALAGDPPPSGSKRTQLEVSLAYALAHQHRFDEARQTIAGVLRRCPADDEARLCDAQLAFFMDDPWPEPWEKLEARWALGFSGDRPVAVDRVWNGSPLNGRSVLLAGEGGLGDQIQFVRFAAALARAGAGRVTVSAHPPLVSLFEGIAGVDAVISTRMPSNIPSVDVEYDVAVPMLTVPRFIPPTDDAWAPGSYLRAADDSLATAIAAVKKHASAFNVGVCWHSGRPARRLPLTMFRPLAEVPGIRLFALGEPSIVQHDIAGMPVVDFSGDVAATAANILALDLVITVDTMVAHLAGALGRPTWLLLHYLPDWRWGVSGTTTRWYPAMRLFRQTTREWTPVIDSVVAALRDLRP